MVVGQGGQVTAPPGTLCKLGMAGTCRTIASHSWTNHHFTLSEEVCEHHGTSSGLWPLSHFMVLEMFEQSPRWSIPQKDCGHQHKSWKLMWYVYILSVHDSKKVCGHGCSFCFLSGQSTMSPFATLKFMALSSSYFIIQLLGMTQHHHSYFNEAGC